MIKTNALLFATHLFTALGCGLVAGIFFAFSTFVMAALADRPPPEGIAAMQAINVTVLNPLFMLAFLGTAVTCLGLAIATFPLRHHPYGTTVLIGSLLYLVGTVLVTIVFNVPLNDALARVDPASLEGAEVWTRYLRDWTFWNHVRTVAALAGAIAFTLSLPRPPG